MKITYLDIYKAADGFRWRLKARNGKITDAGTEGFSTRANIRKNVRLVLGVELEKFTGDRASWRVRLGERQHSVVRRFT